MTYKIKKQNNTRSRSKVVHFNNLKPLKNLGKSTNEDATQSGTPDEDPVASDSEPELITVTVPVSDGNLHLSSEPEEEQEHQTSDVHVQDPETSGMENLGSDNEE